MRELATGSDTEEEDEDELQPRVKYSVILQKEDYEDDDDEEDPLPYVDIGPGYYFFDEDDSQEVKPFVIETFFSR